MPKHSYCDSTSALTEGKSMAGAFASIFTKSYRAFAEPLEQLCRWGRRARATEKARERAR